MKPDSRITLLTGLALLFTAGMAAADPGEVKLTSFFDWEQAETLPVMEWNEGLEGLHPGMEDSFRPSQLYVLDELVDQSGELLDPNPGLVMAWGDESDEGEIIAAWELVLPEDPDLSKMCVTLTAWPRTGMTSISFSLKDVFGVMKGWRWPVGMGPGMLPPNVATTVTIAAAGGAGQAGSTGFWDGGIDLTQVISFEFDESGLAVGGIPLPFPLVGTVAQWNYWHDIIVFPCPPVAPEHFVCYKVKERTAVPPLLMTLEDQFLFERDVWQKKAKEICLPVDKNGEGIFDPANHLVCYDLHTKEKVEQLVWIENQLGEQELELKKQKRHRLCVPSIKRVIE